MMGQFNSVDSFKGVVLVPSSLKDDPSLKFIPDITFVTEEYFFSLYFFFLSFYSLFLLLLFFFFLFLLLIVFSDPTSLVKAASRLQFWKQQINKWIIILLLGYPYNTRSIHDWSTTIVRCNLPSFVFFAFIGFTRILSLFPSVLTFNSFFFSHSIRESPCRVCRMKKLDSLRDDSFFKKEKEILFNT